PTAVGGPDQSTTVGQAATFDGSQSGDVDGDALTYLWDFGDGHQSHDITTSHTYWAAGIYTATLTVSDGFSQAVDTVKVTVNPLDVEPFDFKDNFDRDDSASLGNGWVEAQGDMTISGDHMVNAALKDTHIAIQPSVIGTVQKVKADFVSVDNDSKPHFGIVVRFQDAKNYYLAYRFTSTSTSSTSNGLRLSKIVDGTETVLAQVKFPMPVVGTPFRLKAKVKDQTLTLFVDGVQQLTATDPTLSIGSAGILVSTGKGKSQYPVDNFSAKG